MKRLFPLILLLFLFPGTSWATNCTGGTYCTGTTCYVAQSGSDSTGSGTAASPWLHHPWDLNATSRALCTLQAGDTVTMRRGDEWFDTAGSHAEVLIPNVSGSTGLPITTTSTSAFYKTSSADPLPVISGAGTPARTWTIYSTGPAYSTPWTSTIAGYVVWRTFSGALPTDVVLASTPTSAATCASTANSYWYDSGGSQLYVNVGGDPTYSAGVQELLAAKTIGIYSASNGSYATYSNLTIELGRNYNAEFSSRTGIVFQGNTVRYMGASVGVMDTSGVTNSYTGNTFDYFYTAISGLRITTSGAGTTTVSGNTFSRGSWSVDTGTGSANLLALSGNIVHDMNTSTGGGGNGGGGFWLKGQTFTSSGNTIYNVGPNNAASAGMKIDKGSSGAITGATIHDINGLGVYVADTSNVTVGGAGPLGNTLWNCGYYKTAATLPPAWPLGQMTYPDDFGLYSGQGGGGGIGIQNSLPTGSANSTGNSVIGNSVRNSYQGIYINAASTAYTIGGTLIAYNAAAYFVVNGVGDYQDLHAVTPNIITQNTVAHSANAGNVPAYGGHALHVQSHNANKGANVEFINNLTINFTPPSASGGQNICIAADPTATGLNGVADVVVDDYNLHYAPSGGYIGLLPILLVQHYYTAWSDWLTAVQAATYVTGVSGAADSHSPVAQDPLFVDATNNNFRTRIGSSARGLATPTAISGTVNLFDSSGTVRITDAAGNLCVILDSGSNQSQPQTGMGMGM